MRVELFLHPSLEKGPARVSSKEESMKSAFISLGFTIVLAAAFAPGLALRAQLGGATGVPAHLVVMVEARHGKDVPVIHREDVMAHQGKENATVTDWLPLQGDHAGLDFFVLLDDASSTSLGSQLRISANSFLASPPLLPSASATCGT